VFCGTVQIERQAPPIDRTGGSRVLMTEMRVPITIRDVRAADLEAWPSRWNDRSAFYGRACPLTRPERSLAALLAPPRNAASAAAPS
jgi:hypothetical protein